MLLKYVHKLCSNILSYCKKIQVFAIAMAILLMFALNNSACATTLYTHQLSTRANVSQDKETKPVYKALAFTVVKVWPITSKSQVKIVFGYLHTDQFDEKTLIKLAIKLNKSFLNDSKVRVLLWDNKDDPRLAGNKLIDYSLTSEVNLRVIYFIDRDNGQEYLEYTPDKNKPRDRKKIEISLNSKR